jgi:uncharacterized phage protein gp47/JayE
VAGLTSEGFSTKTLSDLKAEIEASLRTKIRNNLNLKASSRFGILTGIVAERFAELWELALAVYQARTPDGASGAALDDVCAITGTVRDPGSKSHGPIILVGDAGTPIPEGSVVSADGSGQRFATDEDSTLNAVADWPNTVFGVTLDVGQIYTNNDGGTQRVYLVTTAGVVVGISERPSGTDTSIPVGAGTCVVRYLGDGDAVGLNLAFEYPEVAAEEIGPITADAFTLNTIETPISGWNAVTNLLDLELGSNLEDDATLRLRREAELRKPGNSSVPSIRARVRDVKNVVSCSVFENTSNATVGGLPPHSIEVVVRGGTDEAIAAAIFKAKAGGIDTYGTSTAAVRDDEGTDHDINFSRIVETLFYVSATVTKDPANFPVDGETKLKEAIVAWGDALKSGRNVVPFELGGQFFKVAGVTDVGALEFGDVGNQTNTVTWPIGLREIAVFDTSRITLTLVDGVP